eukprot:TRINITY_DN1278_c0_g1_i1.p1 TRINITY_DN1278_c0_g1~~TRINITY_DN1278_c0_g1_i1.p1  ORF type:complete len:513 (-),score=129.37 TRINITY_DN1278_c0_g1_i1:504-2042(-)
MNGSYKRTLYCKECKREIKICNSNPCSFKLNNKYLRLINRNTQFGIDETSNVQSSSPEHTNLIVPKPQDNNFNLQDLEKEITAIETENHPTNPHTNQETPPNPHQDPPKDTETPNQSEGQQETPSSNPTPPPNSASFQNSKPKRRFDKEKEFQPKYRRDYKVNGYKAEVSGKRSKKYQPKQNGKYVVKEDPQHHLIKEPNLQETDYTYDNGYYQHHPHNYFYHYDTSEIVSNLGQINDQRFIMNVHTQMPQINLIFYLNQTYKFACKSHFVCVVGYDVHGMVVEMSVSTPEMEWRLNDLRILWFDFPWEVSSLHPDTRLALSLSRVPAGSIFKARVIELTDKTIRLAPSKYSNPILKISDRMPRYRNFERCPFRYLIIMDFEATCDYCPQPKVTAKTAEIIEFPWIVIDTETLQIVDERQIYVKPDFLDGVTLYTTKLTGITKDILINQKPLRNAIQMFDGYLKNKFGITSPYGKDFRIVTDGIWDLQVQLLKEAEKKNINTDIRMVLQTIF